MQTKEGMPLLTAYPPSSVIIYVCLLNSYTEESQYHEGCQGDLLILVLFRGLTDVWLVLDFVLFSLNRLADERLPRLVRLGRSSPSMQRPIPGLWLWSMPRWLPD